MLLQNGLILLQKPALGCMGIVKSKCVKRSVLGEERAKRQCIGGYHIYMIIWKPLVGECLQFIKKPTKEVDKNVVAVVRTNSHFKEGLAGLVQLKSPWLYPCFYSCPIALSTSLQPGHALTMEVNTDWKSLPMDLKRPFNWLKKDRRKLKRSSNTLSEVKCILYTLLLSMSPIEKSVIGSNVSWDLKSMATKKRCPL